MVADVFRQVNEFPVGRDCDTRGIAGAGTVGSLRLRQFEFAGECRSAIFPGVNEKQIGVAARDVERMAVGRERDAIKCGILLQRLRDLPRLQVHDLDALLAPAAEHHHGFVAAGRNDEVERHAAELNGIAGRIKTNAGGKRRGKDRSLCGCCCAKQGTNEDSDSIETEQTFPHSVSASSWRESLKVCSLE